MNDVPPDRYDEIAKAIESPDSPVGIDAKKTHVLILHKLIEIDADLEANSSQALAEATGLSGSCWGPTKCSASGTATRRSS